eukprot:jgi/Bigna1/47311/estExt_Genewise1.C_120101
MLSIAETRAEIERVQGEIQGLEHQLKSVRSSSSSKKRKRGPGGKDNNSGRSAKSHRAAGTTTTTTGGSMNNMDVEKALLEKKRMEEELKKLNAIINKSKTSTKKANVRGLKKTLKGLMKHKFGYVFNEPVDPIKLNLPTYFEVIKHPMDLGTIKSRLDRGYYTEKQTFAEDIRLVFSNACKFNPPHSRVHQMALTMKEIFENKFAEL